jgi:hypothetical protein
MTRPVLLVQGGESGFVHEDDVREFGERRADFRHVQVAGAGTRCKVIGRRSSRR